MSCPQGCHTGLLMTAERAAEGLNRFPLPLTHHLQPVLQPLLACLPWHPARPGRNLSWSLHAARPCLGLSCRRLGASHCHLGASWCHLGACRLLAALPRAVGGPGLGAGLLCLVDAGGWQQMMQAEEQHRIPPSLGPASELRLSMVEQVLRPNRRS